MTLSLREISKVAHMSETELRQEIAVMLYAKEKLSMGQAVKLAGLSRLEFQRLLADRDISIHYDVADFEADLETLRQLDNAP